MARAIRTEDWKVIGMLVSLALASGCQSLAPRWPAFPLAATSKPPAPLAPVEPAPKIDVKQTQTDLLLALGTNYENHGNLTAAAKAYQDVLALGPHPEAAHRLALVSLKQGEPERALELLKSCVSATPGDQELLTDLGYALYLGGDLAGAEEWTRRGLALDGRHPRALTNLGLILACTDRVEEALQAFQRAGCSEADALSNVGHALLVHGYAEPAEHYLRLAAQASRPSAKASETLSKLASRSGTTAIPASYSTR
jgi:tetratricopeptide (TPR) repeat protein